MDIVYLVKNDPKNNSEELRYSLRSLQNLPHGKVVLAGEKPDWATNVTYLPVPQTGIKRENISANLQAAVASELVSDNFILMNDDFFIMKKLPEMPNLHFGTMADVIAHYDNRYPDGSPYMDTMKALYEELLSQGFSNPLSYELHIPMIMNKENVKKLYNETQVANYPSQLRSFYGNYFNTGGEVSKDVKVFTEPQHNDPLYIQQPEVYLENQTFLSVTGSSFKRGLPGSFVKSKFTEKSIYEL